MKFSDFKCLMYNTSCECAPILWMFCSGRARLLKLEPYCNEEGTR